MDFLLGTLEAEGRRREMAEEPRDSLSAESQIMGRSHRQYFPLVCHGLVREKH